VIGFLVSVGIAFLAVLVLFVAFNLRTTSKDVQKARHVSDAPPADDLELRTRSGETLRLDDLRGHVTLLVSLPTHDVDTKGLVELSSLQQRYEAGDLEIVGLPIGDDADPDRAAEQAGPIPVLATVDHHPLRERLRKEFGDVEVPYTKLLIDAEGRVRARFSAATNPHSAELARVLDDAIESARPSGRAPRDS
jgi:glutathione peroxidase-family protein